MRRALGKDFAAAIMNRPDPAPGSTTRAGLIRIAPAQRTIEWTIRVGVYVAPRIRRIFGERTAANVSPSGSSPARMALRTLETSIRLGRRPTARESRASGIDSRLVLPIKASATAISSRSVFTRPPPYWLRANDGQIYSITQLPFSLSDRRDDQLGRENRLAAYPRAPHDRRRGLARIEGARHPAEDRRDAAAVDLARRIGRLRQKNFH